MRASSCGKAALYVAMSTITAAPVTGQVSFVRGEIDGNRGRTIGDAISILADLFQGLSFITCEDAADVNDDGAIDIADPVYLLRFSFLGGAAPPPPSLGCGDDPTRDALGCANAIHCLACHIGCTAPAVCIPTSTGNNRCTLSLTSCEQVRAAYDFIVEQLTWGCDGVTGCRLEAGHCTIGLGACYYFASNGVSPEYLPALAFRFEELGCVDPEQVPCECPHPPEMLECLGGACAPGF